MTTKLVKWASNDGQIIKSGLSDGYGGKAITTAAHLDYDRHGFEGYPGMSVELIIILMSKCAINLKASSKLPP